MLLRNNIITKRAGPEESWCGDNDWRRLRRVPRANANAAAVYIIHIIYGQGRLPWPSQRRKVSAPARVTNTCRYIYNIYKGILCTKESACRPVADFRFYFLRFYRCSLHTLRAIEGRPIRIINHNPIRNALLFRCITIIADRDSFRENSQEWVFAAALY